MDYNASVPEMANNFGSFLCAQVVPHPRSFSGDGTIGQPRRLGLVSNRNPEWQNRIDYAKLVRKRLVGCGADIASEQVHDNDRGVYGSSNAADAYASGAQMRQADVTTIIYLAKGPSNPGYSKAVAAQAPWRPEWIVQLDNTAAISSYEDPSVFQHARNFTIWPRVSQATARPCEVAYNEAEPADGEAWAGAWTVCYTFNSARILFTGIQVARPRLTLRSLDNGMHAIPAIPSGDPKVPACYYKTADYTCVKDATVQWWHPTDTAPDGETGCWKSMDDGKRYLAGAWPVRDVEAVRRPSSDPCNLNY